MPVAVWVACGEGYAEQASESAWSMKNHMNIDCILVSDTNVNRQPFDGVIQVPPRDDEPWYLNSVRHYNTVLQILQVEEEIVFLDTDCYVCNPFNDLFEVLDRYDIIGTHGVARHTAPTFEQLPNAFPEICIGMLAVRNNDAVKLLFQEWLDLYIEHVEVYGSNDQGPLREALWNNQDVKLYVCTPEYHCRWPFGTYLAGEAKVLHGRNMDQKVVAEQINKTGRMRLYRPGGLVFIAGTGDC